MTTHAFKSLQGHVDALPRNQRTFQPSFVVMSMRTRNRQDTRRAPRRTHRDPRTARPEPDQKGVRLSPAPQDLAMYTCGCGHAFSAGVSTTVDCPRCGADQAW
jgi:hypothetical protein